MHATWPKNIVDVTGYTDITPLTIRCGIDRAWLEYSTEKL